MGCCGGAERPANAAAAAQKVPPAAAAASAPPGKASGGKSEKKTTGTDGKEQVADVKIGEKVTGAGSDVKAAGVQQGNAAKAVKDSDPGVAAVPPASHPPDPATSDDKEYYPSGIERCPSPDLDAAKEEEQQADEYDDEELMDIEIQKAEGADVGMKCKGTSTLLLECVEEGPFDNACNELGQDPDKLVGMVVVKVDDQRVSSMADIQRVAGPLGKLTLWFGPSKADKKRTARIKADEASDAALGIVMTLDVKKKPGEDLGIEWEGASTVIKDCADLSPFAAEGGVTHIGMTVKKVEFHEVATSADVERIAGPLSKVYIGIA